MTKLVASALVLAFLGLGTLSAFELGDPEATVEAKALYARLTATAGKGVLFGHQDSTLYGVDWYSEPGNPLDSDVLRVTGKLPAILGFDLGNLELTPDTVKNLRRARLVNGVAVSQVVEQVKEAWKRGIVSAISWHVNNLATGGRYDDLSDQKAVARVLPTGDKHGALTAALDKVAQVLEMLKDDQGRPIPVIFRPWHEHNGNWFWWGTKGASAAEFQELFRFTVQYLRQTKAQHQLITAFSSDTAFSAEFLLERYPGNSTIDLIGIDDYGDAGMSGSVASFKNSVDILAEAGAKVGRPIALTESGQEFLLTDNWFSKRLLPVLRHGMTKGLVYVMLWRNSGTQHFYVPYPGQSSEADFQKFSRKKRCSSLVIGEGGDLIVSKACPMMQGLLPTKAWFSGNARSLLDRMVPERQKVRRRRT